MSNNLAIQDKSTLLQTAKNLPHALIIEAEDGLDYESAVRLLIDNLSLEITHIMPLEKKNVITIEQIRELATQLRTYAVNRRYIIIHPADSMTESAQNALLKSLEEPSKTTHFILVAHHHDSLLSTIQSRCQLIKLHQTSPTQDEALLKNTDLTPQQQQQLIFLAGGRPLLIKKLADSPQTFSEYQQIATDAKQILTTKHSYKTLVKTLSYTSDRQKSQLLVRTLINMIRFQARTRSIDQNLSEQLDKAIRAEAALNANGNIRLALLQLVL